MNRESSPYRLLVEGPDDEHSVIHLLKRHGIDWDDPQADLPDVHDCGGLDPLLASLGAEAKSYSRLGLVLDANADMKQRWAQAKGALARVGVELPQLPGPDGVIVNGVFPDWRVGAWLMPDNENRGQLEDFLCTLIPAGDPCWGYAREATTHARTLGAAFPEQHACKANVHTWLAWQENPGLPFGTAITAKYFGADSPEAQRFVDWFKRLFA